MEPHNGGLVPPLGPHHVGPAVLHPAPAAPTRRAAPVAHGVCKSC
uniref:Uncharacterized protein n=1 Tax=Arundo donax TaxID=35708 RepID=A0A0A9C3Y6_ARUDO